MATLLGCLVFAALVLAQIGLVRGDAAPRWVASRFQPAWDRSSSFPSTCECLLEESPLDWSTLAAPGLPRGLGW